MKKFEKIHKLNDKIAVTLTKGFGSMIMAYLFAIYGLLPLLRIFAPYQNNFLYWSNWVQLWSLPVIAVGQNVSGRAAERRASRMYKAVMDSHKEQMEEMASIQKIIKDESTERSELKKIINELKGAK